MRSQIDEAQRFIDNGNFKYTMEISKTSNEDNGIVTHIRIKRGNRCPLQENKTKVKDANVLQLISDE